MTSRFAVTLGTIALETTICTPICVYRLFLASRGAGGGQRESLGQVGDERLARCSHVAAREQSTCQARAPVLVLFPQEIFRAITAGRNWRSAGLLVAGTASWCKKVNRWSRCL